MIKFLVEFGYLPEAQPRCIHKGRVRATVLQPNFSVVRWFSCRHGAARGPREVLRPVGRFGRGVGHTPTQFGTAGGTCCSLTKHGSVVNGHVRERQLRAKKYTDQLRECEWTK